MLDVGPGFSEYGHLLGEHAPSNATVLALNGVGHKFASLTCIAYEHEFCP